MTLTSKPLAVIVLVVLVGGILFSSAMGWWQTESTKQAATFSEGEFAGQPNPADIRGSYTFGDVENNFGVPTATLAQAFGISSADSSNFGVKDLETIYAEQEFEIGTASVRLFVAYYTGLPYEIVEEVYLLEAAAEILKAHASLTADQVTYLDGHTVALDLSDVDQDASQPAPVAQTEVPTGDDKHTETDPAEERTFKGKTTFQEVLDWGVPQATIESILGSPMPNPLTKVKDYCLEKGLNFEEIKLDMQVEIDKVK